MSNDDKPKDTAAPASPKAKARTERETRLKAALRANLRRRKSTAGQSRNPQKDTGES